MQFYLGLIFFIKHCHTTTSGLGSQTDGDFGGKKDEGEASTRMGGAADEVEVLEQR
jgi:hypothetical protein